jgi:hypothetical protein
VLVFPGGYVRQHSSYMPTASRRLPCPFRIHRPEPDWDGVPVGNSEGLPGDILKRIEERGEHYQG